MKTDCGKVYVWLMAGLTVLSRTVAAQALPPEPIIPAVAGVAAGPRIQFDNPSFDFGRVAAGQVLKHTFIFTNTGNARLDILDVRPSCGCTTAGTWTARAEPGQTGAIPVAFNSANFSGPVHKSISVTCNASNQPTVVLQLSGTIWKPVDVTPLYVYFSLATDSQTNDVRTVRIVNNETNDLTVFPPELSHPSFRAELKTVRPGKEYEVQVRTVPPVPPGTIQGTMTLKTSATNLTPITVSVIAVVQAPLVAMPAQLMIPAGPLTSGTRLGVTVRNNSSTNVTVSEPSLNLPGVDIQMQAVQPGRIYNLILNFPPGYTMPAGQRGELTMKTTHPQYPTMQVPIMQIPRPVQTTPQYRPPQTVLSNMPRPAPAFPQPPATAATLSGRPPVQPIQGVKTTNLARPAIYLPPVPRSTNPAPRPPPLPPAPSAGK
jgi:hypothetical protein